MSSFSVVVRFKETRIRYTICSYLSPSFKTTRRDKILRRNKYLLNMNAEVKQTFTPVPSISCRSSRKISSYLVIAKLYPTDSV